MHSDSSHYSAIRDWQPGIAILGYPVPNGAEYFFISRVFAVRLPSHYRGNRWLHLV